MSPIKKTMGWTIDGQSLMEKSGRQLAEEMFQENKIICKIVNIGTDGTCGGHWCFYVDVELDEANAARWTEAFE